MNAYKALAESKMASMLPILTLGLIMFLRRPDALLNPQPWAEDGPVFIQQAIEYKFRSLFIPYAGYLHVVPRLVTLLSLSIGLVNTPFVMNFSSLVLGAFSISYFSSKRFRVIVRSDLHRYLLGVLIVCLPIGEVFLNITYIQWFLSIYLTLWVADQWLNYNSTPKRENSVYSVGEMGLAALAFLSCPLGLILCPVLVVVAVRRVRKYGLLSVDSAICLVPAVFLFLQAASSSFSKELGKLAIPSPVLLVRAFSTEVVTKLLVANTHAIVSRFGFWPTYVLSAASVLFLLCAIVKKKDRVDIWLASLIVLSLLSTAVVRPSYFEIFSSVNFGGGERYFFYPISLLLILFVKHVNTFRRRQVKCLLCVYLVLVAFNLALNYPISPFVDFRFRSYAQEFDPDGQWSSYIPINPPGWYMKVPSNPELTAHRFENMTRIGGGDCAIDTIDGRDVRQGDMVVDKSKRKDFVVIGGWAIDEKAKDVAGNVYLVIDRDLAFPTSYGMSRPDVAVFLGDQKYEHSGWLGTIPVDRLTTGPHEMSIWIVSKDGLSYYAPNIRVVLYFVS